MNLPWACKWIINLPIYVFTQNIIWMQIMRCHLSNDKSLAYLFISYEKQHLRNEEKSNKSQKHNRRIECALFI